ncbi:MAG: ABC transporter permease [Acidobacteriota bacterium]|nr:ABC transporter permease [Acidobacteriota bacterium]
MTRLPLAARVRRTMVRVGDMLLRRRRDAELDEEIAAHLDLAAADRQADGISAEEARLAARRAFGSVLQTKEACRERRGLPLFDVLMLEARFGLRGLWKSRIFATIAILTLALAIGANAAIFSVIDAALIRPLPYHDAGRLALVQSEYRSTNGRGGWGYEFPASVLAELTQKLHTVKNLAYYTTTVYALAATPGAELVHASNVSGNFFSTLEGNLVAGRFLGPSDRLQPVVVISTRLARRLFRTPAAAVGAQLTLTSHQYVVAGVAAQSFAFPSRDIDIWMPAAYADTVRVRPGRSTFRPIVRLEDGVPLERARADIRAAVSAVVSAHPEAFGSREVETSVVALRERLDGRLRPSLMILWATVGLVLLIACANLATLLLARKTARSHETSVRVALGASLGRLMTRDFIEAGFLSIAGTTIGLVCAQLAILVCRRLAPENMPWLGHLALDRPVIIFAAGLGLLTIIGVGTLPALESFSANPNRHIAGNSTRSGRQMRRFLCVAEFAAAVVLLVAASLLMRSLVGLLRTDIGVRTENVTTASLDLELTQRPFNAQTTELATNVLSRIRAIPGVRAAGAGSSLPPDRSHINMAVAGKEGTIGFSASVVVATPGYFQALGIRLREGRLFSTDDDARHPMVMIMGSTTARRYFGPGNPIGREASFPMPPVPGRPKGYVSMRLVGIVSDVKYAGLATSPPNQIYRPLAQQPWPALFLAVRTDRALGGFSSTLRRAVAFVDPSLVLSSITPMDRIISSDVNPYRFRTVFLAAFAGLALAIAAIGLFGIMAFSVAQRTTEIGIRMALGARTADVMRMVLREGILVGTGGAVLGLAAAGAMSRLIGSLLFGVSPNDPLSFVVAATVLLGVALAASYIPARRAALVDPVAALRSE